MSTKTDPDRTVVSIEIMHSGRSESYLAVLGHATNSSTSASEKEGNDHQRAHHWAAEGDSLARVQAALFVHP